MAVKTFWRYQAADDDWNAEVYVVQDRDGNVKAVDVKNANVGNSSLGKSFKCPHSFPTTSTAKSLSR